MHSPTAIRVTAAVRRACRVLAGCLVVAASLVIFPNAIPWMIAAWLAGYTLLALCRGQGQLCLIACLAILVVKRPTPAPGLLALAFVILAIVLLSVWQVRRRGPKTTRRFVWLRVLVVWIAWGGMAYDWYAAAHCRHRVTLQPDRPVVCFGDSMTSLGIFGGYPTDLQELISPRVVNLGIGGISARQTVEDHLAELTRLNPQVVVIELGGHDFLRGQSRASTKAYLKTIIDSVRKIGAEVVLMEVPRAFISDPYWGLEREIARQEDVELASDTALRKIFLHSSLFPPGSWLGEPYLTDETGIHANQRGNQILAEHVAASLERMYGQSICRH